MKGLCGEAKGLFHYSYYSLCFKKDGLVLLGTQFKKRNKDF